MSKKARPVAEPGMPRLKPTDEIGSAAAVAGTIVLLGVLVCKNATDVGALASHILEKGFWNGEDATTLFILATVLSITHQTLLHVFFLNLRVYESVDVIGRNLGFWAFLRRLSLSQYPLIISLIGFSAIVLIKNHFWHLVLTAAYLAVFPALDVLFLFSKPARDSGLHKAVHTQFRAALCGFLKVEDGVLFLSLGIVAWICYSLFGFGEEMVLVLAGALLLHALVSLLSFWSHGRREFGGRVLRLWASSGQNVQK